MTGSRYPLVATALGRFAGAHAPEGTLPGLAWQVHRVALLLLSQLMQIHIHPRHAGQLPLGFLAPTVQQAKIGRILAGASCKVVSRALCCLLRTV